MPATLVLSGGRSWRTYASSVTCSAFAPSQPFQLRVMVMKTARASATTRRESRNFSIPPCSEKRPQAFRFVAPAASSRRRRSQPVLAGGTIHFFLLAKKISQACPARDHPHRAKKTQKDLPLLPQPEPVLRNRLARLVL